ncbi:MAG: hypothetical protein MUP27_05825 [Desulfobacterales bacterium]|nr:hypothetical protein [Desulfobacterales bacterium]
MMKQLRTIVASRYAHLCIGLLALYGVSWSISHTSHFEKVMDTLMWYCYADYEVRKPFFPGEVWKVEFYKEKYKERLSSLAEGSFDYRDKKEVQAFFMSKGFLYDVWEGKKCDSYILAPVIEKGHQKTDIPEKVAFDYFILGDKKIVPFAEYENGPWARGFVSGGEKGIYIHRDSLEPLLRWYFESLWITEPRAPEHFHNDPLTYSLYRDLQGVCEGIFIKRSYPNKQNAQYFFIIEGFDVFLPTLLAMGARMAADRDSNFPPDYQYLRACLTGLSLNPNHTMLYMLKTSIPDSNNPQVRKGWEDLRKRLDITYPDQITLEQISKVAQEILEKMEESSVRSE